MRDTPIAPRARWPEPQPVPRGRPPVPPWNSALLPGALAPWVADIAERVQCPPDFVAVGLLVAAAAVISQKVAIRPNRQDDWAVVPNLWGLAAGPPGIMKSPALAEALRPLHRLVTGAQAQYEEHMLTHQFRLAEMKARGHDLARPLRAAVEHDGSTEDVQHAAGGEAIPRQRHDRGEARRTTQSAAERVTPVSRRAERLAADHGPAGAGE